MGRVKEGGGATRGRKLLETAGRVYRLRTCRGILEAGGGHSNERRTGDPGRAVQRRAVARCPVPGGRYRSPGQDRRRPPLPVEPPAGGTDPREREARSR